MNGKFSDSTSIPDDALRNDLFGQFIKAADPYMLIFSAGDINDPGVYRNMPDEENSGRVEMAEKAPREKPGFIFQKNKTSLKKQQAV